MIPEQHIVAWSNLAPWANLEQVEQDLIISRALVHIFSDEMLRRKLRFRGGTALHKLHLPAPLRYSEDIDLVRTTSGPIGPILDQLRLVLEPWLGHGTFDRSHIAPKLRFHNVAESDSNAHMTLKVEINIREIDTLAGEQVLPFEMSNPWFSGKTSITTFSREEMLATKLRALLQRDKGRDLFDLAYALDAFEDLDIENLIAMFGQYSVLFGRKISRAQAQERMLNKLVDSQIALDMKSLLPIGQAHTLTEEHIAQVFQQVFTTLIDQLPGKPWAHAQSVKQDLGISW